MSIKLNKLPISERPYEKLEMYGAKALSNSELLAIIIKTGTKQETAVELAQRILSIHNENNNLRFLEQISIEELTKIKSGCGYYIATLCYTNSELNFRREMVLDFKKHTRADLLCRLLVPFLKRENQTKDVMKNIEYISKYLSVLELKDKRFKKTLTYRFIRLFVCFILIGDLSHASMTADFVIQQAFLSEGVDNAVRQNIKDLLDARGRVDEMFDSYTGAAGNSGSSFNSAKEKLKTVARNVKDTVESEYFKN